MALSLSTGWVNNDGREMLTYGTTAFPIAFFDDDLVKVPVPWHWHEEFEIAIITEGFVQVRIANSEFTLGRGDGYFANSGILHSAKLLSSSGHQHCLVFAPEVIASETDLAWAEYIAPILLNNSIPFIRLSSDITWQKEILRLSDYAWTQGAYEKKDYLLNVRFNLGKSFGLIRDHMDLLISESSYNGRFQKDEIRIKKCLLFIESNYSLPITIDDIANCAEISVSTCLRLFKEIMNTTPIQYLISFRIEKIAEELNNPNRKTIGEIAYSCGFQDAAYFNRCFKRIYGCTPTEYIHTK